MDNGGYPSSARVERPDQDLRVAMAMKKYPLVAKSRYPLVARNEYPPRVRRVDQELRAPMVILVDRGEPVAAVQSLLVSRQTPTTSVDGIGGSCLQKFTGELSVVWVTLLATA
jgi:hypothetical protein